jgi:hypothetical protein
MRFPGLGLGLIAGLIAAVSSSYTSLAGTRCSAGDLTLYLNLHTVEQCEAACDVSPTCTAFAYHVDGTGTNTQCVLVDSCTEETLEEGWTLSTSEHHMDGFTVNKDTVCSDGNMTLTKNTNTLQQCFDLCEADEDCRAFAYQVDGGSGDTQCLLASSCTATSAFAGWDLYSSTTVHINANAPPLTASLGKLGDDIYKCYDDDCFKSNATDRTKWSLVDAMPAGTVLVEFGNSVTTADSFKWKTSSAGVHASKKGQSFENESVFPWQCKCGSN